MYIFKVSATFQKIVVYFRIYQYTIVNMYSV